MHQIKFIHIICTEPRIQKLYHDYLVKNNLFGEFDTIQYENPILDFLNPNKLDKMMERIKLYQELHGPDKIILFDHLDCGAYKKNGYKFSSFKNEVLKHQENNEKVVEILRRELLDMGVEIKYIKINEQGKAVWINL